MGRPGPPRARLTTCDVESVTNSLFSELKRRKVFRVGAAYAIVAWLLIQAGDILLGNFGAPEWVFKSLVVVILLGFPLAVFLSWAYELTPDGMVRTQALESGEAPVTRSSVADYLLVGALLVVGGITVADFVDRRQAPAVAEAPIPALSAPDPAVPGPAAQPIEVPAGSMPEPAGEASIAVLPFTNMSPDPDDAYFADGIADEVLNVLSRIDGLMVASRTSAFSFRGTAVDVADIAARLGVAHVLEGSLRRQGPRVRISAQLIDARRDRQLWSDTFDRELEDIFAIQEEIAQAIADALGDTLGIRRVKVEAPTEDLDAYEQYLRGRELFALRKNLLEARDLLESAVGRDPGFAPAWAALGATLFVLPGYEREVEATETYALAAQAAERALSIDSGQPLALSVLAMLERYAGNLSTSGRLLRRALETDPNNADAWLWLGMLEGAAGRLQAARQGIERAYVQDPLGRVQNLWMSIILTMLGENEAAAEPIRRATESGHFVILSRIDIALATGEREEAAALIREWSRNPTVWFPPIPPETLEAIGEAVARAIEDPARRPEVVEVVQDSIEANPEVNHWAFFIFAGLPAEAMREAVRVPLPVEFNFLNFWYPHLREFREQPEFLVVAEQVGLVSYWEEFGHPDYCQPAEPPARRLECKR
jgi:adenylate cyclase